MVQIEKVRELERLADQQTDIARWASDLAIEMGEAAQVAATDYRKSVEN